MGSKKKGRKKKLSQAERKAARRHSLGTKAPKQGYAARQEAKVKSLDLSRLKPEVKDEPR